jgi:hypothetical protein
VLPFSSGSMKPVMLGALDDAKLLSKDNIIFNVNLILCDMCMCRLCRHLDTVGM